LPFLRATRHISPQQESIMHEHAPAPAVSPRAARRWNGRTILVIIDDAGQRSEVCRILRTDGFRAIPASQGVEAQWCLGEDGIDVDLIVSDLLPPTPDGYNLAIPYDRVRSYTPVLFAAVTPREEQVRRGLLHPRAAYVRLPVPPRELVRVVRETLRGWRVLPAA
jgi:two-component system cell cycle sensor histidine kinase/response regulator CckA